MNQLIFYHVWKKDIVLDLSNWFNNNIPLRIIAEDEFPEQIVYKHSPNICWITPTEFEIDKKKNIYIKLPSFSHVPIINNNFYNIHVPQEYGVMVPIFDFDWVYYIKSETDTQNIIRFSPEQIYIENKMTDRGQWIQTYIQPLWETLNENRSTLDVYDKRMLFGLSKVLEKWETCQHLLSVCDWSPSIFSYDKAEISYFMYTELPTMKRKQVFFQNLLQQKEYWIETWWELLECVEQYPDFDATDVLNFILKKISRLVPTKDTFPLWCQDMPICRWVRRKIMDEYHLYQQETLFLKRLPSNYNFFKMRYLFSKVLDVDDPSFAPFFTQECTQYFTRLIDLDGCETGIVLASQDDIDFVPSSSGLILYPENPRWYVVNVRKVNYRILSNGAYITVKDGQINCIYNGVSKNEFYFMDRETLQPVSPIRPMKEDAIVGKREEEIAIVGLEDVRLVSGINQDIMFYGVTKSYSYSDAIRIIIGKYDIEHTRFVDTMVIHPPYEENACEKNWTWCGQNMFIYRWNPLEIGFIDANHRLVINEHIPSPVYFKEFRGSSPAVVWKGFHFFSVHSVAVGENGGRKYLHSIVVLDLLSKEHQVIGVSSPFCFENVQIEYSIGMDIYKGKILFLYSTRDTTSKYMRLPLYHVLENMFFINPKTEILFKTRIMQDIF